MKLREHPLRLLVLILCLAFAARIGFACWWQFLHLPAEERFEFPDSESYWELGQRIATGEPYQFGSPDRRAFRAPGYPLLLAGLFQLTGVEASPLVARIVGAGLGTLSVGLVFWCARPWVGPIAGLWGATLMALDPGQIATSGLVLAEAPFSIWMLLQLGLWQRSANAAHGKGRWVLLATLSGVAAGIGTLIRPSWLLFTPLLLAACRLSANRIPRWPGRSCCALLGLTIVLAPWTLRNWQVFHQFIPTSLQVGASLYDGLNPDATGGSNMQFVDRFTAELKAADAQNPAAANKVNPFEVRLDRRMRDAALDWAQENPGRVVQLAFIKFLRTWSPWPNEPSFQRWFVALPVAVTYIAVMALAIVGTWRNRSHGWRLGQFWLPAVYFTLLHIVFVGSIRYRQPAMLALAVPAGAALAEYLNLRRARSAPSRNSEKRRVAANVYY